jgi:peptide/nickel transport system permease protein
MPERSPDAGEQMLRDLEADEAREDLPAGEPSLLFTAVTAGPEVSRARKRRGGLGFAAWVAIFWLVVLVGAALLAPVLPIPDPNESAAGQFRQGPSLDHIFGSDVNGRDILARTIWGARNSLLIGVGSIVAGFLIGGLIGVVAGYFKGRTGGFLGAVMDILLAYPALILALSIVTFLGREVRNVMIALAIVSIPLLGRIARASTLSWSEREFVVAARSQGAKHGRVMLREVVPNVLPAMFSIALLGIAVVIVAESSLAIIGAGVKPDVVTWGNIIVSGQGELQESPHIVLIPSMVIFFTVLALNFLGDVVRSRFDVRESAL